MTTTTNDRFDHIARMIDIANDDHHRELFPRALRIVANCPDCNATIENCSIDDHVFIDACMIVACGGMIIHDSNGIMIFNMITIDRDDDPRIGYY
jgi:hypothetical protein